MAGGGLMYLLDTNILLELLLDQEKADQAVQDLLVPGGMGWRGLKLRICRTLFRQRRNSGWILTTLTGT
jgi:hypothetical protein